MLGRALEVLRGCETMLGMLGNAKRKLNTTGKDIRTLGEIGQLVHGNNGTYIAVLYYAAWCPFSRELRPVYDVLSSVFPSIHHVAVEESSVRPR